METQPVNREIKRIVASIGGTLLLISTWGLLFVFIKWTTEVTLVYWASAPDQSPLGVLERPMKDFFATSPASILPAVVVTGISAGLFVVGVVRATNKVRLSLAFVVTNLAFIVADIALGNLAWDINAALLPKPRPLIDVGYHYTWPVILVTLILLSLLYWIQGRMATFPIWRRSDGVPYNSDSILDQEHRGTLV